jgi:calcium-dependent protein kinase
MGNEHAADRDRNEKFDFHPDRLFTSEQDIFRQSHSNDNSTFTGTSTRNISKNNQGENIEILETISDLDNKIKVPTLPKSKSLIGHECHPGIINIETDLIVSKNYGDPYDYYTQLNKLGDGLYGEVYKVQNKITGQLCALKKMIKKEKEKPSIEDEMEVLNEIEMMKKMDHPNIVKIFQFYNTKDAYYIVMEYCAGGELYYEIVNRGKFSEEETSYIMYQILSVVFYCHSNDVVHRDLKPENVLIERKEKNFLKIKVCDFGTAKIYEKGRVERRIVGSSYYIAPEVLSKSYDEKCDLWSCGVIMYILLSGLPPFEGDSDMEVMEKVRKGKYELDIPEFKNVSKDAKNLITSLMQLNPKDRLPAGEALKHNWFKTHQSRQRVNLLINDPNKEKIVQNFLNNLKSFKIKNILQLTTIAYLVHNFPQMEEIENAHKLFNKFDVNSDGKITKDEFLAGLRSYTSFSQEHLEEEAERIFNNIDTNHNGFIEVEEFVRAAIDKKLMLNNDIIKFAFTYFDFNKNGEISFDELKRVFDQDECNRNDPEIQKQLYDTFQQIDLNKNGKISLDEFKIMMQKILNEDSGM